MAPRESSRSVKTWQVAGGLLFVCIVALLGYAFWPTLNGTAEAEESSPETERVTSRARIQAIEVQPTDFVLRAEATGHLTPWRMATVSADGSGRVVERRVEEGDFVEAGDTLLRLDDREQVIALKEAESNLLQAQSEYITHTGSFENVTGDTTAVAQARDAYNRARADFAEGRISEEARDAARRRFESEVLRTGARRDAVSAAVSGLSQAEQAVDRARLNLARMTFVAPFRGRVADLEVEVGQNIGSGTEALTLLDDTRMKVDVDVLEADLVGLREGGTARVRIPAMQDTVVTGRIFSVNPIVNSETGTGKVTVAVNNPRGELISGLFAYVELEKGRLSNRLVVPAEAVLVRQGKDLVFVVEEGRAQWTYVTVGRRSGDLVELIDPVQPGDSVAVAGHHSLSHDARVEVEPAILQASN